MRKSRGQSLIEFITISILALGIIIFGLNKFGSNLANFFAGNNVEKKFNNSRTVKFERPQDLVSNVSINIDGLNIEPPVEKIIKAGLASGNYVQTSGSAGRIAQMNEIMSEYVDQIKNLTAAAGGGAPQKAAFENALDLYKETLTNVGDTGFLDKHTAIETGGGSVEQKQLEKKLNMLNMAISLSTSSVISDIDNTFTNYIVTLATGNRQSIISNFTKDMMGFGNQMDYFIDPMLYVEYLNEDKKLNSVAQDQNLLAALTAAIGGMSEVQKANTAGRLKIFYNGGYSQTSPTAYNGERMCSTYNGVMISETQCEIPVP